MFEQDFMAQSITLNIIIQPKVELEVLFTGYMYT